MTLLLLVFAFLAGLARLARRSAAVGGAPQLVLGVLPLALLFVPVQVLLDIAQLVDAFKTIARTGTGTIRSVFALCLEHQKVWSLASWLVLGAISLAGIAQMVALRRDRQRARLPPAPSPGGDAWLDLRLPLAALLVLPVCFVVLYAQRIEAGVMGFAAVSSGVDLPPPFANWGDGQGVYALGEVIGRDAVLSMIGALLVIGPLLALAAANAFMKPPRQPAPWITALGWAVLAVTCILALSNALHLNAVAGWAEQVLPSLPRS